MRDVYFWFSLVGWAAAAAVVLGWLLLTKMRKRQS
jgi:hypothetical protein